jgi:hypothetical protein
MSHMRAPGRMRVRGADCRVRETRQTQYRDDSYLAAYWD